MPRLVITTRDVEILKDDLIENLRKRFSFLFEIGMSAGITFLDFYYKDFELIEDETERRIQLYTTKKFILDLYKMYFSLNNERVNAWIF